ncbi:efflux RND transporter periplasmic adaptor subunit [Oceanospirillum linum]|uniref:Uncharacterized protein n=1 Tax=Oceanospirillum linum TaxID=966 RepID=A0A1T1HB82_OCELI|nr:efflux RND transporter periplasmic adaptor subunit [Oceanospirillum linum]OOV87101.1 hypothetical protein BTA35_0208850 [Oceanospirillum linum]SEF74414.1 membrane fusion protein, multidrug efflux system [Oleiphilus messinensis]SMP16822.1 membrane fusion protein, multidrug efflux system [Oceanospirillum linum]
MKHSLSRTLTFGALLPFISALTFSAIKANAAEMPPMPVEAQVVQAETLERTVEVVGSLSADESVVISPEVAGRVAKILFREGQMVKAGMPLIKLDDSIPSAELKQAEASRGLSEVEYKRANQLVSSNAGSVNTRDSALAKLRIDQAGVALAKERLGKMTLNAPFDGLVGLREVSVGEYVTPGQSLVSLVSVNPLRIEFRVPEVYLTGLAVGQSVAVSIDAIPGEQFKGTVFAVSPEVDVNGRSVKVVASLPNDSGKLRPGLFARVNLNLETIEDALLLQEEALVPQGNVQLVYVLEEGKVAIRPVVTGIRERGRVQVLQGVKAGDIVVTAGQMKLRPGAAAMPVNLQSAKPQAEQSQ